MSHPDNAPRFDDLEGLALGDIAALPPEMLLDLQTTALAETARVKRLRDRLEAGIAQRYEAAAAAERAAQGKTCGTVRVEDEGRRGRCGPAEEGSRGIRTGSPPWPSAFRAAGD